MTGKTDNWSWGHLGGDVETPRNLQQGALRRLLVMGNVEPEPTIFCNQARIPVVGRRYQPNRKTFHLRFILPAKCAGLAVPQNLWEWPKTDGWIQLKGSATAVATRDPVWMARKQSQDSTEIQDGTEHDCPHTTPQNKKSLA